MSSRLTMILAGLFLLAALLAGYWGLRLSRPAQLPPVPATVPSEAVIPAAPVPVAPPEPPRSPIVVLRRAVPANTPLSEEDLLVERLQVVPAGAFQQLDQVLGRSSARPLAAGSWLDASSFQAGGPLARMIRPHERAVAVAVDDVIGAGGQLRPGDYVDVLLFLREENNNPQSSAQVVLPALRVLSVDQQTGLANDGRLAQTAEEQKARRDQQALNSNTTRTVGLAVPEALASRLMLAAQAGTLRLAVRSADEQLLAAYWSGQDARPQLEAANRNLYRFSQLSQVPLASQSAAAAAGAPAMQIIRGAQNSDSNKTP
ncbi:MULTISPECIES: Flp pilus assembly protein CpaB [unclassified Pseudomonas]|uniref:Flp pilus assembly protein CpaB n=1 Tax=unclassified Pseudomonas TaxID=196821 RepID=UPI00244D3B9F|nr:MULTISPECIES: Flp pilus assembly protein CpaB [unclassified Pseudomonas]MDH0305258.1 Flp pilus assembly protein CpaB [Pseudomonas sp. GD04091]MDH1986855.1 Flp pilus assembly protein CpaB [Pseudomonas sp. GD03689]